MYSGIYIYVHIHAVILFMKYTAIDTGSYLSMCIYIIIYYTHIQYIYIRTYVYIYICAHIYIYEKSCMRISSLQVELTIKLYICTYV